MRLGVLHGPFVILDFGTDSKGHPVEPPLVYFEGNGKEDLYVEKDDSLRRYHEIAQTYGVPHSMRCRLETCSGRQQGVTHRES